MTMVVFRNFQWGAEKRNTTLSFGAWESDGLVSPLAVWRSGVGSPHDPADLRWYDDNFVGTELNKGTAVGHQMVWLVSYGHYGHTEPSPVVDRGHPVARRGICGDGQGLWPEGREGWQCR